MDNYCSCQIGVDMSFSWHMCNKNIPPLKPILIWKKLIHRKTKGSEDWSRCLCLQFHIHPGRKILRKWLPDSPHLRRRPPFQGIRRRLEFSSSIYEFHIFLNLVEVFNKGQNAPIANFIYLQSVIGFLPLTPKNWIKMVSSMESPKKHTE